MGERVTVSCLHCGDENTVEVEAWAKAPTRVYCDDACFDARDAAAVEAAAVTR